jgi:hypothetical protein
MLSIGCAGRSVGVDAAVQLPDVMFLVVEDACARLAQADRDRRRPRRWQLRALRRWRTEGKRLQAKAERIQRLSGELLDR